MAAKTIAQLKAELAALKNATLPVGRTVAIEKLLANVIDKLEELEGGA